MLVSVHWVTLDIANLFFGFIMSGMSVVFVTHRTSLLISGHSLILIISVLFVAFVLAVKGMLGQTIALFISSFYVLVRKATASPLTQHRKAERDFSSERGLEDRTNA